MIDYWCVTDDQAYALIHFQSGGEDGCYRKKIPQFLAWAEPGPKTAFFRVFGVPFDYPAHSLQETVLPQTNGTDGKPRL